MLDLILTRRSTPRNMFTRACVSLQTQPKTRIGEPMGCRLMAGQRFLVPYVRVRLLPPQPFLRYTAQRTTWLRRLAVQDAALSRRRSPVRIRSELPVNHTPRLRAGCFFATEGILLIPPAHQEARDCRHRQSMIGIHHSGKCARGDGPGHQSPECNDDLLPKIIILCCLQIGLENCSVYSRKESHWEVTMTES